MRNIFQLPGNRDISSIANKERLGLFLMVQWLGLCALNAGGTGLIPGNKSKILHALQRGQNKYINKWKWKSQPTLYDPVDHRVHGILQARILEWVFPSPGDLPNPGIKPRSHTRHSDSLPAEPQGKSKNTGGGSLSLLQGIFLTQELNWGLLHCGRILYQLNYQGHLVYRIRKSEIFF